MSTTRGRIEDMRVDEVLASDDLRERVRAACYDITVALDEALARARRDMLRRPLRRRPGSWSARA